VLLEQLPDRSAGFGEHVHQGLIVEQHPIGFRQPGEDVRVGRDEEPPSRHVVQARPLGQHALRRADRRRWRHFGVAVHAGTERGVGVPSAGVGCASMCSSRRAAISGSSVFIISEISEAILIHAEGIPHRSDRMAHALLHVRDRGPFRELGPDWTGCGAAYSREHRVRPPQLQLEALGDKVTIEGKPQPDGSPIRSLPPPRTRPGSFYRRRVRGADRCCPTVVANPGIRRSAAAFFVKDDRAVSMAARRPPGPSPNHDLATSSRLMRRTRSDLLSEHRLDTLRRVLSHRRQ
jgi:hypothetical protein